MRWDRLLMPGYDQIQIQILKLIENLVTLNLFLSELYYSDLSKRLLRSMILILRWFGPIYLLLAASMSAVCDWRIYTTLLWIFRRLEYQPSYTKTIDRSSTLTL